MCHWVIACAANMEPMQFKLGDCLSGNRAHVKALAGRVSAYYANGVVNQDTGKALDYVIVSQSWPTAWTRLRWLKNTLPFTLNNTGCFVCLGALVFENVLSGETEVLSGETLFHRIGPLRFHRENNGF